MVRIPMHPTPCRGLALPSRVSPFSTSNYITQDLPGTLNLHDSSPSHPLVQLKGGVSPSPSFLLLPSPPETSVLRRECLQS